MKLKIKKEEILKGLQRIQGVVEKKNTMPILSNMLLIADSGGVEIIATDLEIGLRGRYTAVVEKPGAVTGQVGNKWVEKSNWFVPCRVWLTSQWLS